MSILRLFTIPGLVAPDVAKLSVDLLPVKMRNLEIAQRELRPGMLPGQPWSVDGPHSRLDVSA